MKRVHPISFVAGIAALCLTASAFAQPTTLQRPQRPLNLQFKDLPNDFKAELVPEPLTVEKARAHVIRPASLEKVESYKFTGPQYSTLKATRPKQGTGTPYIDTTILGPKVHAALIGKVNGYMFQVRQGDQIVSTYQYQWAKRPGDGSKGWDPDTRMHVASVSKLITAMGMIKALEMKGISEDAKIINYLPSYWGKGFKVKDVTFRQLLRHESGFITGGSDSDYGFMKNMVAFGAHANGHYDYENMNFGICRILIPIVMGFPKNYDFGGMDMFRDMFWDLTTRDIYKKFMQQYVFTPSGVYKADWDHVDGRRSAMAYSFPAKNDDGWDSGDLGAVSGGAGFRLSTKEVLAVMTTFRKGTIVSATRAQYCLDNLFGIDNIISTDAGKLYNKNGSWRDGDGHLEQCAAYFLPNNTQVIVFVNSPVTSKDVKVANVMKPLFADSIR